LLHIHNLENSIIRLNTNILVYQLFGDFILVEIKGKVIVCHFLSLIYNI
jgi:hypothetical protein